MVKYPAIQDPNPTLESLHRTVKQLKELVEILTEQRGTGGDAAVTWDEFDALGGSDLPDSLATIRTNVTENSEAAAEVRADLEAFAGPYESMASYNTTVTAAYENYADNAADDARATAEARATAALAAFSDGYSSLASYEVHISATYTTTIDLETNYATISEVAATYATQTEAYAYYTLTLDVNGYVSGFTSTNDGDVANITFLVDNLKVAKPGSVTPKTFLETGLNAAGATTIVLKADTLKVGSVVTEVIEEEAATAVWSETDADVNPATTGTQLAAITVDVTVGTLDVYFEADVIFQRDDTSASNHIEIGMYLDSSGTPLFTRVYRCVVGSGARVREVVTMSRVLTGLSVGSHTIKVKLYNSTYDTNTSGRVRQVNDPFIRVIESRR